MNRWAVNNNWVRILLIQVGIPIAAGMLLPITGTMLTPSIAGALMGLSSVAVMTNSLLLRYKFSTKLSSLNSKAAVGSTSLPRDHKEKKMLQQHAYSGPR